MKRFIMVTPQQKSGALDMQVYEPVDNSLLAYGQTRFPLIPLINGYADDGDSICVHTVTYDSPNCDYNLGLLREELETLGATKSIEWRLDSIGVPFDDGVAAVMHVFQELINRMEDDDELHACITFGSKPMPVMITMALRYAYQIRRNASIECVVYGQRDYSAEPPFPSKIYDLTALVKLDEVVRIMGEQGVQQPEALISEILDLGH